jgi:hypothetical protein
MSVLHSHCECCDCDECRETQERLRLKMEAWIASGGQERMKRMFGGTIPKMTTSEFFSSIADDPQRVAIPP